MGMVAVLKAHLGAGWYDPSRGGGRRQSSDIYRAGEGDGGLMLKKSFEHMSPGVFSSDHLQ